MRPRLDALEEVIEKKRDATNGTAGSAAASDDDVKTSPGEAAAAANKSSTASLNDTTTAAAASDRFPVQTSVDTDDGALATATTNTKQKQDEENASTAAAAAAPAAAARRVIIVGDSLVTGVGCSSEHDGGPMLPRCIGERLADLLGAPVEWVALGRKGADLKTIRAEMLPALRARLAAHAAAGGGPGAREVGGGEGEGGGGGVDVVVLMCGVNDLKYALTGRTAAAFHRELDQVVGEILALTGDKCWVILPGLPMDCATIFNPPLSYLAVYGGGLRSLDLTRLASVCDPPSVFSSFFFFS